MAAYVTSAQNADGTWCYPEIQYAPRSTSTPSRTIRSDARRHPVKRQKTGKGESFSAVQHVIKFKTSNSATRFWAIPEMRQIIYELLLVAPGELKILNDNGCIPCEELGIKCNRMYSDKNCWPCCKAKRQCVLPWCLPVVLQTNDSTIENSPNTQHKEIWPHILRACYAVYTEAIPILYGHNKFLQYDSLHFNTFAKWNRGTSNLKDLFGFPSTYIDYNSLGRLALMKNLHINLTIPIWEKYIHERDPFDSFYAALKSPGTSMQRWALQPHSKLKVDFSRLNQSPEAVFEIEQDIAQLISSLKTLEVVGLSHEGALQVLKKTMEQHGGRLIVL